MKGSTLSQNLVKFDKQAAEISLWLLTQCHGHCQRAHTDVLTRTSPNVSQPNILPHVRVQMWKKARPKFENSLA